MNIMEDQLKTYLPSNNFNRKALQYAQQPSMANEYAGIYSRLVAIGGYKPAPVTTWKRPTYAARVHPYQDSMRLARNGGDPNGRYREAINMALAGGAANTPWRRAQQFAQQGGNPNSSWRYAVDLSLGRRVPNNAYYRSMRLARR